MRRTRVVAVLVLACAAQSCGGTDTLPTAPSPPTTASVVVSGWLSPLIVGQSVQLSATAFSSDGTPHIVTTEAAWTSSNAAVAIVSPVGLVMAQGIGSVEIRASYQGKMGELGMSVTGPELYPGPIPGLVCGVERWPVKTLSDSDATRVDLSRVQQTTIHALNERAAHCSGLPDGRTFQEEFQVYEVIGRITFVRLEDDRDFHIAVADPADTSFSMVTEVADIACQGAMSSPYRNLLELTRNAFVEILGGRSPSSLVGTIVRLRGVGFFDFNHCQTGRARNCLELHPIIEIQQIQSQ